MNTTPEPPTASPLALGVALCAFSFLPLAAVLGGPGDPVGLLIVSCVTALISLLVIHQAIAQAKREGDRMRVRWGRVALAAALIPLVTTVGLVVWVVYAISQMGSFTLM